MSDRWRVFGRQVAIWLGTLLLIRLVVMIHRAGVHEIVLALVPILFMYVPVYALRAQGEDDARYPLSLPMNWAPWRDGLLINAALIAVVGPLFLVAYHIWQTQVFGHAFIGTLPSQPLMLVGYHLFFVAIPEEMYYRGFMQSRLDQAFGTPWRIAGAALGPGLLLTCVLFAVGHSIVQVQWWHFAIIFPSLIFGWLRNRTNDVVAGALFHAWCNVTVAFLDTAYGVVPP